MKKVRIQLLTKESEFSFEIHQGLSETVEGQSLPVSEILTRFQRGTLDMPIAKRIYYDNIDDFITDPTQSNDFDLADATILRDNLNIAIQTRIEEASRLQADAIGTAKKDSQTT